VDAAFARRSIPAVLGDILGRATAVGHLSQFRLRGSQHTFRRGMSPSGTLDVGSSRAQQLIIHEPACKPGSVPERDGSGDGHFSSRPVARPIEQPTRESLTGRTSPAPILGLAPGGVCRASLSPGCWWALTPPFHPYHHSVQCSVFSVQ